jgi:hypothetical protein
VAEFPGAFVAKADLRLLMVMAINARSTTGCQRKSKIICVV